MLGDQNYANQGNMSGPTYLRKDTKNKIITNANNVMRKKRLQNNQIQNTIRSKFIFLKD